MLSFYEVLLRFWTGRVKFLTAHRRPRHGSQGIVLAEHVVRGRKE